MSRSILVRVEPAILRYARKHSGFLLDEVVKKTKISKDKLELLEEKKGDISISDIEKLSTVYKRPLAFFLLPVVPDDAVEPKDFRIVYESESEALSPAVHLAIRRARHTQSVIAEFFSGEIQYQLLSASLSDDPQVLAEEFRKYLGISDAEQGSWASSAIALREWRAIIEKKNIFVLQNSLSGEDVSAFCLADKKPFVVMLNSSEPENRRIFSLFHEIGHILLHSSGICTPEDLSRNSYKYIQIEKFCNQFSASLLVPRSVFVNNANVVSLLKAPVESWDVERIKKVASRFKVSKDVILRRFLSLGLITEQDYKKKKEEWGGGFDGYKKKKGVIVPQHIKCLSQNGRGFASFIFEQYRGQKISFSAAADILNINPKHMTKLEAIL